MHRHSCYAYCILQDGERKQFITDRQIGIYRTRHNNMLTFLRLCLAFDLFTNLSQKASGYAMRTRWLFGVTYPSSNRALRDLVAQNPVRIRAKADGSSLTGGAAKNIRRRRNSVGFLEPLPLHRPATRGPRARGSGPAFKTPPSRGFANFFGGLTPPFCRAKPKVWAPEARQARL